MGQVGSVPYQKPVQTLMHRISRALVLTPLRNVPPRARVKYKLIALFIAWNAPKTVSEPQKA